MDKVQPGDKCEEPTCWDVPERDAVITCDECRRTKLCDRCYNEQNGEGGKCSRRQKEELKGEIPKGMIKIKTAAKKKGGPVVWRKRGEAAWKRVETEVIKEPDGTESILMIDSDEEWDRSQERSSSSTAEPAQ